MVAFIGKALEEREQIVKDSFGNIDASCDGCMTGLAEMYQDYIEGKRKLRDINMGFHASYAKDDETPVISFGSTSSFGAFIAL